MAKGTVQRKGMWINNVGAESIVFHRRSTRSPFWRDGGLWHCCRFLRSLKRCGEKGFNKEKIADLILYMLIGGVVGARLLFVLQNFSIFMQNPVSILSLHQGGLSFHGAALGGAIVVFVYTRLHRLAFLSWRIYLLRD
jgi:prolipoprotein diacylglyceryltransferase